MTQVVCSECSTVLTGKRGQKTCSDNCRSKRSRRLRDAAKARAAVATEARKLPPHQKEVEQVVRREAQDVAHEVLRKELEPIVRSAITEETLRAIQGMVGLAPRVVELLAADLESSNPKTRQTAMTLITRYTLGHPAILKHEDSLDDKRLTVNFNLPRPDTTETIEVTAEEEATRTCDMCNTTKPDTDFVANSKRCQMCYDELQAKAAELLK